MKKILLLLPFLVAGLNAKSNLEQRVDLLEKDFSVLVEKLNTLEERIEKRLTEISQENYKAVINGNRNKPGKPKKG